MLNVRRFVKGVDGPVWDEVLNASRRDSEEWGAIAVEELLLKEKRPGFDFEGRFIAELDGKSVGLVHADVDKLSQDRDRKSTRLNSSHGYISYAVFCLKK